jgi:phosphoglycerate dehydrogenase-like enzyme
MRRILKAHPTLRWVHTYSAGVEHLLPHLGDYTGRLTNSAGVHAEPMAEWAVTMMLAHCKRLPLFLERQQSREWRAEQTEELAGKTLGVVGAGGIGQAFARRAAALGMDVVGVRASGAPAQHFRQMYGPDRLHDALGMCDYVLLATPLTPETTGLIGEAELGAMRPSAVLLNVGRGKVVRTDALVAALAEGAVAGAMLDVTDPEPLPSDHPLWGLPNVIITPHTSALSPRSSARLVECFCENLRRWLRGEPLLNEVDLERGY